MSVTNPRSASWLLSRPAALCATVTLTAAASVLATWPLARDIDGATMRAGEVLLTAWQLNWYHHALLTDPSAWVDANIFFPYQHASTFNDLLLTHALITLPAAWAQSPVLALNLAFLGGIVLCGVCAHLLIRELVDAPWAAATGGILFALAPFRFLHLGHLSIAAAWPLPLFFWAILAHLRRPSWGRASAAVAAGIAVTLSSLYHAAFVVPIVPLVLWLGARRGPGGRRAWVPLLATGAIGLILLVPFVVPFATTLRSFGVAAGPDDLQDFAADIVSLTQKPVFLGGGDVAGIDAEAYLYPGAGLALLGAVGATIAVVSLRTSRSWVGRSVESLVALSGFAATGCLTAPAGPLRAVWTTAILALIWVGPVVLCAWAWAGTTRTQPKGPDVVIRFGLAGAALAFVLALGPEARLMGEPIGHAPYRLLTEVSSAFHGTRVPARFGSFVILFLALVAAGAVAALGRGTGPSRLAGRGIATLALIACLAELPLPSLPGGRELVPVPDLRDPAYRWLADQDQVAILELPEWTGRGPEGPYPHRAWRALRYMLASKQHGQHLVNGTGRIEPFLFHRFRTLEQWDAGFFDFIVSYYPIDYVLVHEGGIPADSRSIVWAALEGADGPFDKVFQSAATRVYRVDRSEGRGAVVDRLVLRARLAPMATVAFSARAVPEGDAETGAAAATLELLRDGAAIDEWGIDATWRAIEISVPVDRDAPDVYATRCSAAQRAPCSGWPAAGVLFRWQVRGEGVGAVEIRDLSIRSASP